MTLNPNTQNASAYHPDNDRHGAIFYSSYIEIHETVMQQFRERHFIGHDTLEFIPISPTYYLQGRIFCLGQIIIDVEKALHPEFLVGCSDPMVRTKWYAYNVSLQGAGNIFRYDNQDKDYLRPGHDDDHHKHTFNIVTSDLNKITQTIEHIHSPVWIGRHRWPTLGDVLAEIEAWYWENYSFLPYPDSYPSTNFDLDELPPSLER